MVVSRSFEQKTTHVADDDIVRFLAGSNLAAFLLRNDDSTILCNQLRGVVQSSVLMMTKQFSPMKAKFFSMTIFISVHEFEVNGYLRKFILRHFFCT